MYSKHLNSKSLEEVPRTIQTKPLDWYFFFELTHTRHLYLQQSAIYTHFFSPQVFQAICLCWQVMNQQVCSAECVCIHRGRSKKAFEWNCYMRRFMRCTAIERCAEVYREAKYDLCSYLPPSPLKTVGVWNNGAPCTSSLHSGRSTHKCLRTARGLRGLWKRGSGCFAIA